jgi:tRNA pseudouridine55 synthase
MNSGVSGMLLLNKPPGITSFDALWTVKRALGTKKAGHTGTLDKFASGLLVVLAGRALKLSPWFTGCSKRYEAVIRFGAETDTLDPEGETVAEAPPPNRETLEAALPRFLGDILQAPPLYSALHINGERAHKLARAGKIVEMKKRPVTIHSLELISWDPPLAHVNIHCSSGTYIRSLARDLALASGSRAHLAALKRTAVAGFSLADALEPDENAIALRPIQPSVFDALGIPWIGVDEAAAQGLLTGRKLNTGFISLPTVSAPCSLGIFKDPPGTPEGSFVGIIEKKVTLEGRESWQYGYVYAAA